MQYRAFIFILLSAFLCGLGGPQARAQISTPEVQVDLSVLRALDPSATDNRDAAPLQRNVAPNYKPLLTNRPAAAPPPPSQPQPEMPPVIVSRPPPAAPAPAPAPEKRQTSLQPGTVVPPLPAAKPYKKVATTAPTPEIKSAEKTKIPDEKTKLVSFPVKTSSRSETSDPSLPPSPQSEKPVAAVEPPPQKTVAASPFMPMPGEPPEAVPVPVPVTTRAEPKPQTPLPNQKPKETKEVEVSSIKVPPLPPRRPEKQKASESFVAEAQAKNISREIKPAGASGFSMPAVPALPVKMEKLPEKKTAVTDKLEAQMLRADRDKILKTVEAIADQRENKTVKDEKIPSAITANDLKKTMSEPYIRKKSMPDDITAAEPAAGGDEMAKADIKDITAKMVPRPPPQEKYEEDYISMPFQAGKDALDDGTLAVMQENVLTQLQNNPSWRIQIQAFASPTDEGSSSARRLSLARALAVRTWLMDKGIEAGRMDVRALGMQTDRNPADRVDLIIFDPKNG